MTPATAPGVAPSTLATLAMAAASELLGDHVTGGENNAVLEHAGALIALVRAFDHYLRQHPGGRDTALAALRAEMARRE